jgi:soluble lytic murein transglycosylase-like protein
MFSQMIQNLLSSSGQQVAEQRLTQIQSYVNAYNLKPTQSPLTSDVKPFSEILQNGAKAKFGSLLTPDALSMAAPVSPANSSDDVAGTDAISALSDYAKPSKPQLLSMISKIAHKHGIDEKLVKAVIKQESGFNPKATSRCGAAGLMQLMPGTARGFGVTDLYNPVQNVDAGCKYLKNLLKKYNGNVILALAAYNAGSGAVSKYNGVPPYKETQNYVRSILANYLG